MTTLGSGVDGSVRRLTTAYNTDDLPYLYTSYNAASGGTIVNQVEDVYNGLGQLTGEYQEQNGAVNTSTTPEVQYAYTEMSGGQNNSRLTQMIYPNGRDARRRLQHRPGQHRSAASAPSPTTAAAAPARRWRATRTWAWTRSCSTRTPRTGST